MNWLIIPQNKFQINTELKTNFLCVHFSIWSKHKPLGRYSIPYCFSPTITEGSILLTVFFPFQNVCPFQTSFTEIIGVTSGCLGKRPLWWSTGKHLKKKVALPFFHLTNLQSSTSFHPPPCRQNIFKKQCWFVTLLLKTCHWHPADPGIKFEWHTKFFMIWLLINLPALSLKYSPPIPLPFPAPDFPLRSLDALWPVLGTSRGCCLVFLILPFSPSTDLPCS